MVKIDLITGFLGSGKTTFIRKYAQYLMDAGNNIGILENDYGAVNVDMMLLQDLMGENCELEMISGGCDKDCHRRRFKTKLIAMGMCGYDRVIVEPSGIFDVDEFFDILHEEPLNRWYQIGNVIAIVDSKLERDLKDEVIAKYWDDFTEKDYKKIMESGYQVEDYEKRYADQTELFQTLFFMDEKVNAAKVRAAIKKIFKDRCCGEVLRIKGFLKDGEQWLELNATHHDITLKPIEAGQDVLIVIGEKLNEEKIRDYLK